jgi:hypothetical protein
MSMGGIAVRSNLLVTCLVDVVLQLFKLGHRMALMGFVLTIGLTAGYVMTIGFLHRPYILKFNNALKS